MVNSPARPPLWDRITRTLRPAHGARANAADALFQAQRARRERAEATAAVHGAAVSSVDGRVGHGPAR